MNGFCRTANVTPIVSFAGEVVIGTVVVSDLEHELDAEDGSVKETRASCSGGCFVCLSRKHCSSEAANHEPLVVVQRDLSRKLLRSAVVLGTSNTIRSSIVSLVVQRDNSSTKSEMTTSSPVWNTD